MTDSEQSDSPRITVGANLWVGDADDPMEGAVVVENARCVVAIERTDSDEVAIHATLPGDDNALVSVYMTRADALAVSKLLETETIGHRSGDSVAFGDRQAT